jgi:[ribosomal protein S18]-alanine N-acetyltransferase
MTGEPCYSFAQLSESDDLDQVASLEAASFTTPWTREMLARDLLNGDVARLYGLRGKDSRILAFCACWVIADELHINTLAVAETARRRGLATALLRAVLTEAAGEGVRRATLEVRRSNEAALRLYAALGFVIRGVRPNYYTRPEEDGLILWRDDLDVFEGRARS